MTPLRSLFALILTGLCLLTQVHAQVTLGRHPYVQMTSQQSATILWRTVGESVPILRYGPTPESLIYEILPVDIVVRISPDVMGAVEVPRLHSAPIGTYQYEATALGLDPDTKYYYGVFDDDQLLAGGDVDHWFTTTRLSTSTDPLRLWVVGDSGNGSAAQIAAFDAMKGYVAADGKPVDAYLHLGDMAYNIGRDDEFSRNFFEIYSDLLRNTVVWPTMGNHEGSSSSGITQTGPYYDAYAVPTLGESGGEPSGTEAYYSFDIGRVHFICLDSHDLDRTTTGDMALWLRADLEMAEADWLIAFWHHPPYTKGTHDSDAEQELLEMREFIMPILESGGVDLVLGGHSHTYERSMLIDGAYATPTVSAGVVLDDGDGDPNGNGPYLKSALLNPNEGTVAVVAGNGRSAFQAYGLSPVMRATIVEIGSVIIDIDGDTLTGKMLNLNGVIRDEFQMVKQGMVTPSIVQDPWQPVGPGFRVERSIPGETVVEIVTPSGRPDTVVYYTIDGTTPDETSAVYTGPITIAEGQSVRALEVWMNGERRSPVSVSVPLRSDISIKQFLASAHDDAREDSLGEVVLDDLVYDLGDGGLVGLRFDGVSIPDDVFIVRAQIEFEKADITYGLSTGTIWGELAEDSMPFSSVTNDLSSRARTTTTAAWTTGSWVMNPSRDGQSQTADLSGIIREIIAQPGWQNGNAMSFLFDRNVSRFAFAYESGSDKAAALFLTYIDPEDLVENFVADGLRVGVSTDGYPLVAMRLPYSAAMQALGVQVVTEISTDLADWQSVNPVGAIYGVIGLDGFQNVTLGFEPNLLVTEPRFYIRAKMSVDSPNP